MNHITSHIRHILLAICQLCTVTSLSMAAPEQINPQALEKVSLQLSWKHQFQFAGFYAAVEQGYFAEQGLEVEIREFQEEADPINEVSSGRADFGIYSDDLIFERMEGRPVVLLANYFKRFPLVFLAQPGLKTLEDLKGKRLMITDERRKSMVVRTAFHHAGLIPGENLTLLPPSFDIGSLVRGETDAFSGFYSNEPFFLDRQNIPYELIKLTDALSGLGDINLFTSDTQAAQHPDRTRAFVEASNRGWKYALDHPEETVDLILEEYKPHASREALLFEADETRKLMMLETYPIGSIIKEHVQSVMQGGMTLYQRDELDRLQGLLLEYDEMALYSTPPESVKTAIPLTAEEQNWIRKHPHFTVGSHSIPPYSVHEREKISGYIVEMLQAVSSLAGLEPEFRFETLNSMYDGLRKNTLDVGIAVAYSPERDGWLEYSEYSTPIDHALLIHKEQKDITDLASLKDKVVAVVKGAPIVQILEKHLPDTAIVQVADHLELFRLVSNGKVDAAVHERQSAEFFLRQNLITNIHAPTNIRFDDQPPAQGHYFVVRKDLTTLKSILDKGWYFLPTAEKERIWNHWINSKKKDAPSVILTLDEQTWLRKHPVVRIPVVDFPPYLYWKNGPQGVFTEVMEMTARKGGFEVVYQQQMTRQEAMEAVRIHEHADIVPGIERTPEHEELFGFPSNKHNFPLVIFTREKERGVYGLDALAEQTVVVEKDFNIANVLSRRFPKMKLLFVDTADEALQAVSNGNATAYVGVVTIAQHHIGHLGLNNLKVAATTDLDDIRLGLAVRKDWPELVSIINKARLTISPEERNAIYRKHFVIDVHETFDYQALWQWLLGIALLFASVLLWNFLLRRKVAEGTAELRQHKEQLEFQVEERTAEVKLIQARSQTILEGISESGEGLLIIDAGYRISYMNPVMVDWFGEQTGNTCYSTLLGKKNSCSYCRLGDVIQQGKTVTYHPSVADGRTFEVVATPIANPDGSISKMGVFRDVSARIKDQQALEESRQQLALALDAANLGLWDWRPQTDELFSNDIFLTMLGYDPDALPQTTERWSSLVHLDDLEAILNVLQPFLDGDDSFYRTEQRMRAADGQWKWILAVGQVVQRDGLGKAVRFVGVNIDITERREAEQRLVKSEQSLTQAQELAHLGSWNLDIMRNELTWSPEAYRIYEIDPELSEASYDAFIDAIHPDDRDYVNDTYNRSLQTGKPFSIEHRLLMKDDRVKYVQERCETSYDATGNPLRSMGSVQDITGQKETELRLRTSQAKFQRLVDDMGDKFVVYSSDGTTGDLLYVSEGVLPVFGMAKEELLGVPWNEKVNWLPESRELAQAHAALQAEGKADFLQFEIHFIHPDGDKRTVRASSHPVRDVAGKLLLIDGILENITKHKQVEQQLIDTQQQAEAANRAKSEFLANMSHDIRTPMNGIIGMTRLVLDTELTLAQQGYLESIKLSADGLLGLLNDILDISKIEAGQLAMEKYNFSLPDTLDSIISIMTYAAKEKNLDLTFQHSAHDLPSFVKGDNLRLRQILVNLIGNSIKFTEKGSVTLKVIHENRENNRVELHFMVIDTGIGIPADKQETIFSSFSQADASTTRQFGGTGLGLSICKLLVDMMGGKIWLERNEGQGATFHFTAILDHGDEKNIHRHHEKDKPKIKELDILLVDDNNINCEIARHALEKDKHRVVIAQDGLEALELLICQHFDLILMDIQMPIMDGLTASEIIRSSENGSDLSQITLPGSLSEKLIQQRKGRHIPIVAMTAGAMTGDKEKCLAAGMDNYVTKPFEPAQIRTVIADVIKSASE